MADVADVASWIVDDSDTASRSWGCKGQALGWWRDTTDVVVLNSPWLCRGTGRLFRCLTISFHALLWTYHIMHSGGEESMMNFPARFCVMVLCLAASLCVSLMTSRESFGTSMLFGTGVLLSSNLFTWDGATSLSLGVSFIPHFAMMCHCNVHPLVLFLGICDQLLSTWDTGVNHVAAYSFLVAGVHSIVFECAIIVAFTLDFTQRVKAVSSGILFGDGDELLESPVAGRSARIFCWFSGVNQWFLFCATIIENEHKLRDIQGSGLAFLRNHLPFSSFAVPCISVGLVLLAQWSRCRIDRTSPRCRFVYLTAAEWFNDFAFALFCCAPAVLMTVNYRLADHHRDLFQLYWYDYRDVMLRRNLVLCITGVQTLVQGGCHPLICVKIAAIFAVGMVLAWPEELRMRGDGAGWILNLITIYLIGMLLALSHLIDFFARMRAIETGMLWSQQNAASSQMLLR